MELKRPAALLHVPDGLPPAEALARTTHLGVCAHQDDLEILAFHGILAAFSRPDRWFAGVVVTDGAGSARDGAYRGLTDAAMRDVRRREQLKAAHVGEYGAVALLDYPSSSVKDPGERGVVDDLVRLLSAARPEVVYTHNLADRHDTHVAVALRTLAAVRELPAGARPEKVYGCEVWRDLDWLAGEDKVALDVSGNESLAAALLGVFDSQICGGKRYDLATLGRRRAHATYHESHRVDAATALTFAVDLTPLVADGTRDPAGFALELVDRFRRDVAERLARLSEAR